MQALGIADRPGEFQHVDQVAQRIGVQVHGEGFRFDGVFGRHVQGGELPQGVDRARHVGQPTPQDGQIVPEDRHIGEFFGQLGESLGGLPPAEVRQGLQGRLEAPRPGRPLGRRPQRRIVLEDQGEPAGPVHLEEPFSRRGIVVGQEHL